MSTIRPLWVSKSLLFFSLYHRKEAKNPWQEALINVDVFNDTLNNEWLNRRNRNVSELSGHKVFVSVTPINFARDGFALEWNNNGQEQALIAPFSTYNANGDFNHPDVKTAYLNYCKRVIEFFGPDYLAIGIEVNLLRKNSNQWTWDKYVELNQYGYS